MERVAVVGFSRGGPANVLAAARGDRIRALASIDGSVRAYPEYVNGGPKADRPLEEINEKGSDASFNPMNRMRCSDVYIASMRMMSHMDFSSWILRINGDAAFEEHTREEAARAYNWTARHMMSMDARKAKATAPTRDTFLAELSGRGFARIVEIYDALHAQDAAHVFRLGAHVYPDVFDFPYDDPGDAYEAAGEREPAIANCQRALGASAAATRP